MKSVRSFFVTLSGFTFVAILALFTASMTVALAGILSVLLLARAASIRLSPAPVRAKAQPRQPDQQNGRQMRIWNDGRGPIIDM
jgi:hypothetical protein